MSNSIIKNLKGDKVIWSIIVFLFIFSILAVYSSIGSLAFKTSSLDTTPFIIRHIALLVFGLAITYGTHQVSYKWFGGLANVLLVLAAVLLVFTILLGESKNEASRWIMIPFVGIQFQTSDFAKFALIVYEARLLAYHLQLSDDQRKVNFKRIIIPMFFICGLIFLENISTAGLLYINIIVMMFIGKFGKENIVRVFKITGMCLAGFLLFAFMTGNYHRLTTAANRLKAKFGTEQSDESNYQANQAKIAIVTGGLTGKGPGESKQRDRLPQIYSDFIYALIVEEYGSLIALVVLFSYMVILYRSLSIVTRCDSAFPAFLTAGLSFSIVIQALINMGVAVNLLPVTGQPLPFVSRGGTSIIFTSISMGIILAVSHAVNQPKEEAEEVEETENFDNEYITDKNDEIEDTKTVSFEVNDIQTVTN